MTNFDLVVVEKSLSEPMAESLRGHIKAMGFDEETPINILRDLHQEWWEMVKVDD